MSSSSANVSSSLLTSEENETVFTIVGHRKQSKATAVVQMFHAHPDRSSWNKFKTGVVCFVKDNNKKSYYIRLIDLSSKAMVYEQEVYNQFTYKKDRPYFHSFPGDKFMVGLNFADDAEAESFYKAVNTKLAEKFERKQSTLRRQQPGPQLIGKMSTNTVTGGLDPFAGGNKVKPKRPKGSGKLLKSAIGAPTDFRHLSHVGFDPSTGAFDSSNIDPQWRKLLDTVGVTNEQLKDENTATFIYDFVEKHGGIQEANRQLEEAKKKSHGPPPPPSRGNTSRGGGGRGLPPPPPRGSRGGPPPPPSSSKRGGGGSAPAPPPPPPVGVPAPPPPPPIGGAGPPKPPPSAAGGPPPPPSRESKPPPAPGGDRGDLLASIRAGKALKHVDQQQEQPVSEATGGGGGGLDGMAGALAKALAARQQVIQGSDDEDENEDDDEWEDEDDWGSS